MECFFCRHQRRTPRFRGPYPLSSKAASGYWPGKPGMTVKAGFTLMEVSVTVAVLAAGIVVFGRFLDGFNRIRALEREQARAVLETAHAVEHFVQNPPACRDTTFAFGALAASNQTPAAAILVTLKTIPGPRPIAWLSACVVTPSPRTTSKAPVFRRLVRCVKD